MPEDRRPPRTVGAAAQAAARLCDSYGLSVDHARQLVTDGVFSEQVSAFWINPHGERRRAVAADFSGEIDFREERLATEPAIVRESDAAAGFSMAIRIFADELEIDLLSLDRYAAAALGAGSAPPSPLAPPASPAPDEPKNRGGRPAVHDWDGALAQAIARVWEYGLPESQDQLSGELLPWFDSKSKALPDRRTVEKRVAEWWPLLERVAVVSCELRPVQPGGETP